MTEVVEETFTFVDKRAVEGLTKAEVKELERLLERVSQNLVALSEEQKNEEKSNQYDAGRSNGRIDDCLWRF